MKKVGIKVLECTVNRKLAPLYGQPDIQACPFLKEGDSFVSVEGAKPEGFCESAWQAIYPYVFALGHGAPGFWLDWSIDNHSTVLCCNDGLRPVVVLVSALPDEE